MDFKDFFDFVRNVNEEYLKPADANIKYLEEYLGENGIDCISVLKNLYEQLIEAIQPDKVLSNKGTIDVYLKKYKSDLRILLIKTYLKLIDVRMKDLLKNIHKNDAANIKEIIKPKKTELIDIIKKEKDPKKTIECSKALYDLVETYCAKYYLA